MKQTLLNDEAELREDRFRFVGLKESLEAARMSMPILLDKLHTSLTNIEDTTTVLRATLKQASPEMLETVRKASDAAKGARDVVESAKKIWPINGHLPEENSPG